MSPRQLYSSQLFIALFLIVFAAALSAGCTMAPGADRPRWSLNDPKPAPVSAPAKKYADWNGAKYPRPLTYGDAPSTVARGAGRIKQPMAIGAATTGATTMIVGAGETLTAIARRFGLTADQLKRFNGLASDNIAVGQKLSIPARS